MSLFPLPGTPLAPNRGKYGERKRAKGLIVGVGLRSKKAAQFPQMLLETELAGEVAVTPDTAIMKYGRTPASRRKAGWFTAGATASGGMEPSGAEGQPARPFYGLSAGTRAAISDECRDFVRELIRRWNGGI